MSELYAQDVNYWRTGTSSPDTWIDKAKREIAAVGGRVTGDAFMNLDGKSAYSLLFTLEAESYRINWPVLMAKSGGKADAASNERAARIQAATFLYHDVKAKCMVVKVMGARAAFAQYLLAGGTTIAEQGFAGGRVEIPLLLIGGAR